ncbi:unannotated protein [freshwater metagenome]|uniref:Unannotated protein n=1 Tax=freshwater metagenome TaxID=449393 RepID=A0A6J7IHN2_9ZZZZ|nr:hypothetical protein [Actinomycetota bacterium]
MTTSDPANETTTSGSETPLSGTPSNRRFKPRYIAYIALLAIATVCIVMVARLGTADTTELDGGRIQRLIPTPGAKILQQDIIGIDMAPGYEASLALNGIPLPVDQTYVVPQTNQVTFKAGPGKVYETLPAGQNCMIATYWQTAFGPSVSSRRSWCFTVI